MAPPAFSRVLCKPLQSYIKIVLQSLLHSLFLCENGKDLDNIKPDDTLNTSSASAVQLFHLPAMLAGFLYVVCKHSEERFRVFIPFLYFSVLVDLFLFHDWIS